MREPSSSLMLKSAPFTMRCGVPASSICSRIAIIAA